jgi:hypothetical protein
MVVRDVVIAFCRGATISAAMMKKEWPRLCMFVISKSRSSCSHNQPLAVDLLFDALQQKRGARNVTTAPANMMIKSRA